MSLYIPSSLRLHYLIATAKDVDNLEDRLREINKSMNIEADIKVELPLDINLEDI